MPAYARERNMEPDYPHFFERPSPLSIRDILALTGLDRTGSNEPERVICDIAPIDRAGPNDIAFIDSPDFVEALGQTNAGAIFAPERFAKLAPAHVSVLQTREPYKCFVTVARIFYQDALIPTGLYVDEPPLVRGSVHASAQIEQGVIVDPGAVVGPRAKIGKRTLIGANAVIAAGVEIGEDCVVGPCSTISHAIIGNHVIIHPGCHIGQDGFGYIGSARGHIKVPQIGRVVIHDHVEIGAGTTIDRGGMRDTIIGEGTKIDNLLQIGHNTVIGRHCIIVAQSGLSGSVTLEDFVVLGAKVGIKPHVTIGKGAQLSARASVMRDVPAGERWGGAYIAKPLKQFFRETLALERLAARRGSGASQAPGD